MTLLDYLIGFTPLIPVATIAFYVTTIAFYVKYASMRDTIKELEEERDKLKKTIDTIDSIKITGGVYEDQSEQIKERKCAYDLFHHKDDRYRIYNSFGEKHVLYGAGAKGCTICPCNTGGYVFKDKEIISWEDFKTKFPDYEYLVWDWKPLEPSEVEMVSYTKEVAQEMSDIYVKYRCLLQDVSLSEDISK